MEITRLNIMLVALFSLDRPIHTLTVYLHVFVAIMGNYCVRIESVRAFTEEKFN